MVSAMFNKLRLIFMVTLSVSLRQVHRILLAERPCSLAPSPPTASSAKRPLCVSIKRISCHPFNLRMKIVCSRILLIDAAFRRILQGSASDKSQWGPPCRSGHDLRDVNLPDGIPIRRIACLVALR